MLRSVSARLLVVIAATIAMVAVLLPTLATPASGLQDDIWLLAITADKIEPGNDGWVAFTDGTKQWVSPDCRAELEADGIEVVVVDWPTIRDTPDRDWEPCDVLLASDSPPDAAPDAKIIAPASGARVSAPVVLSGTASDDVGVTHVQLIIFKAGTRTTWDGSRFTSAYTRVQAEVERTRSGPRWSYEMVNAPDGRVAFSVFAFDTAGQVDEDRPWRAFNVSNASDNVAPNGTITAPAQSSTQTGTVTLSGTAEDNLGVDRVQLTIFRAGTNLSWDGSDFTPTYSRVNATVTPSGTTATWSYDLENAPPGRVAFSAFAFDAVGNLDQSRPWRSFVHEAGDTGTGPGPIVGEAENLALILENSTRNTSFDNNPFYDVPMADIQVSDLTENRDAYNEGLLDTSTSGYFRVKCEVSHFAYDDPIIFPNQPGRAHLHMFFGNTEANAYSTFDSLLNTGTGTCNGEDLNRTAYWVPAMLDADGNALIPYEIMVYYKNDNFRAGGANELVSPFPDNLRMIAGRGSATSPQTESTGGTEAPWARPAIEFSCGPAYNSNNQGPLIPDCYGTGNGPFGDNGRALEMSIAFPQCFNEADGTYLSDQSHMSYSEGGYYGTRCPDSHPTDVSSIMYRIFFSPDEYGGALTGLHLSSDVKHNEILPGGTTAHADWFGAWHPEAMDMWVNNCNNMQEDCEIGLLQRYPSPVSLVPRQRYFYPSGYLASAAELSELCPSKEFNPSDPLRSVASCEH